MSINNTGLEPIGSGGGRVIGPGVVVANANPPQPSMMSAGAAANTPGRSHYLPDEDSADPTTVDEGDE